MLSGEFYLQESASRKLVFTTTCLASFAKWWNAGPSFRHKPSLIHFSEIQKQLRDCKKLGPLKLTPEPRYHSWKRNLVLEGTNYCNAHFSDVIEATTQGNMVTLLSLCACMHYDITIQVMQIFADYDPVISFRLDLLFTIKANF